MLEHRVHVEAVHGHQVHMKDGVGRFGDVLREDVRVVDEQRRYFPAAVVHEILDVFGIGGGDFQVPHDVDVVLSELHRQRVDQSRDALGVLEVVVPRLDAAGSVRFSAREEYGRPEKKEIVSYLNLI